MNAAIRKRAKSLFQEALDLPEAERAAFVRRGADRDLELETAALELLRMHSQAGDFLGRPTLGADAAATLAGEERAGDRIGPYELTEGLGRGGFGVVWRARQHEPVRRDVALKVIKLGMDTKSVVSRFELERQSLAVMDHPHIARVFDAGATSTGRPYFVMELVQGIPVTQFCDQHELSTEERLQLFAHVCRAVQHAHQKGVIHRDIKPGNILVALHDGRPVPKVIDFGIAKATGGDSSGGSVHTEHQQLIGTPEYMAPEQADRSGLDVDTRADVYSLGVLLYELLTGALPFDARALRERPWDEVVRTLREVEPEKPSTRASTLQGEARQKIARERRTNDLSKLLRGDLDWIVLKALEKDRSRRYETALALAEDVERHLAHLPVLASPPSRVYVLGKFVRRHRVGFGAAAAVAVVLVAGVVATALALVEVRAQRNEAVAQESRARDELRTRRRVARFLGDMLNGAGPSVAQGRDATILREILEHTSSQLDGELRGEDDVRAELLDVLGRVHCELGDLDRAVEMGSEAVRLRRLLRVQPDPDTALAETHLAVALMNRGRLDEAEQHAREGVRILSLLPESESRDRAHVHSNLGLVLVSRGAAQEGENELRQSLEIERAAGLRSSPEAWTGLDGLGELYRRQGRLAEAETVLREVLERTTELLGPDHPRTLSARNALAVARLDGGHTVEAESELSAILEQAIRVCGEHSPTVAQTIENLALAEKRLGRLDDALRSHDRSIELYRAVSSRDWDATARALSRRASVLKQLQRPDDALESWNSAVAMFERLGDRRDPEWAEALAGRADLRAARGEAEGAEADLRLAIEIATNIDAAGRQCAMLHNDLGGLHFKHRRFAEAETEFDQAFTLLRRLPEVDSLGLDSIATNLTFARYKTGHFAKAVESGRVAVQLRRDHAVGDEKLRDSLFWLARSLARVGEAEEGWKIFLQRFEHEATVAPSASKERVEQLRTEALRAMEFGQFGWGRERCAEAVKLDAERGDPISWSTSVASLATLDSALGKPEDTLDALRACLAFMEQSRPDPMSLSGLQLVLASALVDTAGVRNDRDAAQEAESLARKAVDAREQLLKPNEWRLHFARSVLASAAGELARLDPHREGESGRAALRGALQDLESEVTPLLQGDMPMPTLVLRLPVCMLAAARLHEAVGEFESSGEHLAAARALREQVATLRVRPLD